MNMKTMIDNVKTSVAATIAAFHAACEATRARKGKGSGKGGVLKRTDNVEILSSVTLIDMAEALFAANPVEGYKALAQIRRPLTQEEQDKVNASSEVSHQGMLECGEPAQAEIFIQSPIRVTSDDVNGEAFVAEIKRNVRMARAVAQMEDVTLYVRYKANVVVRGMRGAGKNALRARYGGRVYISDRPDHEGTLMAVVSPNPSNTPLGKAEWQVPGF